MHAVHDSGNSTLRRCGLRARAKATGKSLNEAAVEALTGGAGVTDSARKRRVRGQVLRAREFEYVQAARALGASTVRILGRHVIPTAMPAVSVQATLGMGGAILSEASLSFLGLGSSRQGPAGARC